MSSRGHSCFISEPLRIAIVYLLCVFILTSEVVHSTIQPSEAVTPTSRDAVVSTRIDGTATVSNTTTQRPSNSTRGGDISNHETTISPTTATSNTGDRETSSLTLTGKLTTPASITHPRTTSSENGKPYTSTTTTHSATLLTTAAKTQYNATVSKSTSPNVTEPIQNQTRVKNERSDSGHNSTRDLESESGPYPTDANRDPSTSNVGSLLDTFQECAYNALNVSNLCPNGNVSGLALFTYDNVTFSFSACDGEGGTIFSNLTATEVGNRGAAAALITAIYKGTNMDKFVPEFMQQLSYFMYNIDDFRKNV